MPETTEKYHRVPIKRKKKNAKIRTITVSKGIKALYDVKNKTIVTYLFDVNQYTMKEAKEWVKKHKEGASIIDVLIDLDYILYKRSELSSAQKEEVLTQLFDEKVIKEEIEDDPQMRIL